jgi:hypothetical protein
MYKLYKFNGEVVGACYETSSGTCFFGFKDQTNTDYQEYLKWVALGNTPEAAE